MERLDGLVVGEAEGVEEAAGGAGGVLGALPGVAFVAAEKRGAVLLALVLDNGALLARQLGGAQRHGHIDFVDRPLRPRAAIEPRLTLGKPRRAAALLERLRQD